MAETIKTTLLLRRGYEEVWIRNNPVLQCGEPAFTIDKNGLKIGDGIHTWKELEYINDGDVNLDGYVTSEELEKVQENITSIEQTIEEIQNNYATKEDVKKIVVDDAKYRVVSAPKGTLVNVYDNEVRIMCPADTQWTQQTTGETAPPNNYYIGMRIYAPDSSIYSFKESMSKEITDNTMYYFEDNAFAGIDENGRKFSIVWLAVALYNGETNTWTYYGANSSHKKYIGWDYIVEWYDENGVRVGADVVRINLSNEKCHNIIEPYYMGAINTNKLTQTEGEYLVLYGGSASDNI